MSSPTQSQSLSLAILDDYANTAPPHFQNVPNLSITSFPETLNPSKPEDFHALVARLRPYPIISCMRERTAFPAALVADLPNLKLLLSSGMRNAALDLPALAARGVVVTGTRNSGAEGFSAVVQHAWGLVLSLCGRIARDDRALKGSTAAWQSGLGTELAGKVLGVVGLGKLGAAMARVAVLGFGMRVVAWSENLGQERADEVAVGCGLGKGVFEVVGKEELFRGADVVSLHLVLSERSRGVVGRRELGWMGKGSFLVNTSRGGLVDEEALVEVVREGGIGGVALDVFWEEPLPGDSVWRRADEWAKSEVVLSPHMGYVNAGTMNSWYQEQAETLQRWLNGQELLNRMN